MTHRILRAVWPLFFAATVVLAQPGPSAQAEIESLLSFVRKQEDAVFIRNGSQYDSRQAVAHLRLKWSRQKDKIRSAEDFIARCASRSFLSGQPYRIRFKDGTVRETREVLREELARMRAASSGP
jgi:hypothetical protein